MAALEPKKEEFPMEALKAASHRKAFWMWSKARGAPKWEAFFFGGPPSLELRSRPKGPGTHLPRRAYLRRLALNNVVSLL